MFLGRQKLSHDAHTNTSKYEDVFNYSPFSHIHVIGKTRVGKSTFLEFCAIENIKRGAGVIFFDPHGSSADELLKYVPLKRRSHGTVIFDPSDVDFPISFNILDNVADNDKAFVASSVVDAFLSVTGYTINTPVLNRYFYNGVRALLDMPDATLVGLSDLANPTHSKYRKEVIKHCTDPIVKNFWFDFETMTPKQRRQEASSMLSNLDPFITDPAIRNIIGQPPSLRRPDQEKFNIDEVLDEGKILIVRLPIGHLGQKKVSLIGTLLLSQIHLRAMRRDDSAKPIHLYLDECYMFGFQTITQMLSGIGKFHISLCAAHQFLGQLDQQLQDALLGNAGTTVAFRTGVRDAVELIKEFAVDADGKELNPAQLPPYETYVRTDQYTAHLEMLRTWRKPYTTGPTKIRDNCRKRYGTPRKRVEDDFASFRASLDTPVHMAPTKK